MPTLWTEVIEPATLTGYIRESMDAYELRQGSLSSVLPNTTVPDINVRFEVGQHGLTETAEFRAWDAEASHGRDDTTRSVTLELPAIGHTRTIDEYRQLRLRNAGEGQLQQAVLKCADQVVRAVSDRIELLRGVVLSTGKATVNDYTHRFEDDFGRPAEHDVTAPVLWSAGTTESRLDQLLTWAQVYEDTNGEAPGKIYMSNTAFANLRAGDEFVNTITGRPMTREEVNQMIISEGLPAVTLFNRRVNYRGKDGVSTVTPVLDPKKVLFLPSNAEDLGHTYWGETLTATETDFGLGGGDAAGIVAGVYRNETPPVIASIISDAIALPVLNDASKSFAATVLA